MVLPGKRIITPVSLQGNVLNQLHINKMGIEKTRLLASKFIYSINMNTNIEDIVKNCPICLDFLATQPKVKTVSHEISGWP